MSQQEISGTPKTPNQNIVNDDLNDGANLNDFVRVRLWHVLLVIGLSMFWGVITGSCVAAHLLRR